MLALKNDLLRIIVEQVSLEVDCYLFGDLPCGFLLIFAGVF